MKKKNGSPQSRSVTIRQGGESRTLQVAQVQGLIAEALQSARFAVATGLADQVLDQQPGNDDIRLLLYRALSAAGQIQGLYKRCRRHLDSKPRDPVSLEYAAHALRQLGKDTDALPLLEQAVSVSKTNARLLNALGTAYKEQGEAARALDCFNRAIAIKPRMGKAYWNRSDLVSDRAVEIRALEDILERLPADSRELPYFHFSLYRAHEAAGNYDRAFEHLALGNAAKRSQLTVDIDAAVARDREMRLFFERHYPLLRQRTVNSDADFSRFPAIFIIGMPRSGTSLVEQILASHSQVTGGGELPLLTRATETLLERLNMSTPFPGCLSRFTDFDFAQLGFLYTQLARSYLDGDGVLTDKLLLNYKAAPLIRLALPKARIIHVRRDPMDTCFGCYRQLFTGDGLEFCYDLDDLARTWHSYEAMTAEWQHLMGDDLLTVDYEALVEDLPGQSRRLLAYCRLPWEDRCLNFYNTDRPVKTVSNLQVREPVFKSGIGRWKPYADRLQGLKEALSPKG